jgi:signal transduction histidine kinase
MDNRSISVPHDIDDEPREKAISNILEDIRKEKQAVDRQYSAVSNIIEDVNRRQVALERRYEELGVIKDLTVALSKSSDTEFVFDALAVSIHKLFPDVIIAYHTLWRESFSENMVYIRTPYKVNDLYIDSILLALLVDIREMPEFDLQDAACEILEKRNFHLSITGSRDKEMDGAIPISAFTIPVILTTGVIGFLNVSSARSNRFEKEDTDVLDVVIQSSVNTIDMLKDMKASERCRLQAVIANVSNGILILDLDETVTVINPVMRQILGVDADMRLSLDDVVRILYGYTGISKSADVKTGLELAVSASMKETKPVRIAELQFNRQFFEISISPVLGFKGAISAIALIFHNTTFHKEVSRLEAEFVSIASHQLRTPLTAIQLFVEMLLTDTGSLSEHQKDHLTDIAVVTKRMVGLVNDLLDVSHIESGHLKIEPVLIDLVALLEKEIYEIRPLANRKRVKVLLSLPKESIPLIVLDRSIVQHAVRHILTNAIQYTKKDEGVVEVSLKTVGAEYDISVKDNGIGIEKVDQHRIFEKFFRTDQAIKMYADGPGLGLYIVQRMIKAAKGNIYFESEGFGHGTIFHILLPKMGMQENKGQFIVLGGK